MVKRRSSKSKFDKTPESYDFKVFPSGTIALDEVDLDEEVPDEDRADKEIESLSKQIFAAQVKAWRRNCRFLFLFEGWDAAGKGGVIKRLTREMDPRGYKVWPIAAPTETERQHHYLWRFSTRAPPKGEIAIFDRSWYGRVLVERIEGFCKPEEWMRAYDEINAFERMLTDDNVVMGKFFLHIDAKTQLKRFREREQDPVKRYKIGPDDWRNRKQWDAYAVAYQDMLNRTHRPDAKWHVIPANDKRTARLRVLKTCLSYLKSA